MWNWFSRLTPKHRTYRARRYVRPHLEALEARYCPSGGTLDWSDPAGLISATLPWATNNISEAVAIQHDGKIVSAGVVTDKGTNQQEICIVRLTSNGPLDTTFNGTGIVVLKIGVWADAGSVAIQPDGKILVGGSDYPTKKASQVHDSEIVIARYNANGTLDTTFANNGIFTWNRTPYQDGASSLTVLPDNSIVAIAGTNNTNYGGVIFKLNANGSPVTSFGTHGVATFQPVQYTQLSDLAIAPNGDLILSGYTYYNRVGLLFAVNPSTGTLDPSFNSGQGWLEDVNPAGTFEFDTVAAQGNNIVVGGSSYITGQGGYGMLARFSLKGALDTSFANNGYFTMTSAGSTFTNVGLELDGSIVAEMPGAVVQGLSGDLAVGHFTANGQLDTTFGGAGTGFNVVSGARGFGLAIGADGGIVASGYYGPNYAGERMAFFAQLTPPEAMIGSFTASPNPVTSGSKGTLTASNIAADGGTITQVTFYYYDVNGNKVVLGNGTEDSSGNWVLSLTVNLAPGTYTLYAQAQDSDGVLGDPDALTLTVQ